MTPSDIQALEVRADKAASQRLFANARDLLEKLVEQQPAHFDGWMKLSAMERALGDSESALRAVAGALSIRPLDFVALLLRASLLHSQGHTSIAGETYGHALAQAPDAIPPGMATAVQLARERYRAWQIEQSDGLRNAVSAVTPLTDRLDRFIANVTHLAQPDRNGPTHYCFPELPEVPFHPPSNFPWLGALEEATAKIAEDFARVVAAESAELVPYINYPAGIPVRQWENLNNNREWTAIHLIRNGQVVTTNARHCAATMALLKQIPQPQVRGAGPNAMFSLLAPGAHIPPHTGVTNTRLVCHLPLIVPKGCWFRVGDDCREWETGKAWVFDDTIEHEARNPSREMRVILIVDVWHPLLSAPERMGIAAVIGAGSGAAEPTINSDRVQAYRMLERADYRAAATTYEQIVNRHSDDYEAWNNLGNAHSALGNVTGAIEAFEHAIALRPDVPVLYINLSKSLASAERHEDRQRVMREAALHSPDNAEVQTELGLAESSAQNFGAAEIAFRAAIRLTKGFTPAYLELGLLLENQNRIDALEELLAHADEGGLVACEMDFLRAWALRRRGKFNEALSLALSTPSSVNPLRRAQLIAELYDRLGDAEQAFGAFVEMNIAAATESGQHSTSDEITYAQEVANSAALMTRENVDKWTQVPVHSAPPSPVFIMGFPRSGTTLLDTLLMNVPSFHVLEELPVMRQVEVALGEIHRIGGLDAQEVNSLRARYFEALEVISAVEPGKAIVDKYPLHMARVPLIHRIFPDAKFVFVERHPCDVVLSCFMANFQLNRAMRYFGALESAAELYNTVFQAWTRARDLLPIDLHIIRYERMVDDLETEMRSLLGFLKLDWDAGVLDNRGAASKRTHIRTASYSQVTEPIYKRASGRWHRYRPQMEKVLPILAPWAELMGYEI